jgi:hypothetical protein
VVELLVVVLVGEVLVVPFLVEGDLVVPFLVEQLLVVVKVMVVDQVVADLLVFVNQM